MRSALILLILSAAGAVHAADDILYADFEGPDYGAWTVEGDAFGAAPAAGALPHQKPVSGYRGHGLASSMHEGDGAHGRLTLPQFLIQRQYITFLIGGGGWAGKTSLHLLVDGKPVREAHGPNTRSGGSEVLAPQSWDVNALIGKAARLEIVDEAGGSWGHINVDQIVFTDERPAAGSPSSDANEPPTATHATKLPPAQRLLYNGIELPPEWPPRIADPRDRTPRAVPYLDHPPAVIPIDIGRQLFVDDFLIEQTDLKRVFHHAQKYEHNPILSPATSLEMTGGRHAVATLFNDGVWFDPRDRLFKMWYHAGWFDGTCLATSHDGIQWQRPELDVVAGTNHVVPVEGHGHRDGSTIWLDQFASDPAERYKMFLYERPEESFGGQVFTSPDGVHWSRPTRTSKVGDNTTIFYNPFRKKWVYSYRSWEGQRARGYRETDDLVAGANFNGEDVPWAITDDLDLPDPKIGDPTQLYNLDAIAYESLMLGVFAIHRGPENKVAAKQKQPKITELELAYSRDGFHWSRPDRTPFLAATRRAGDWDRAYLHIASSICAIVGDKLYFYYGGWSGKTPDGDTDMYSGAAVGLAFLRRDGFASMEAGKQPAALTTRPVTFNGQQLFVNLAAPGGELRAEVLDEKGAVIAPYSAANCVPVSGDSTRQRMIWRGADDLEPLTGRRVKFRFSLRQGQLFAFWVAPDEHGASLGYVAAGGPEFAGPTDTAGDQQPAMKQAKAVASSKPAVKEPAKQEPAKQEPAEQKSAKAAAAGELLYNGIQLPAEWPPRYKLKTGAAPAKVPYLEHRPEVIPIDVGRQLFVDDFLIERTTLEREFHYPERFAGNPILRPELPTELNGGKLPLAAMISDGVCYDPWSRSFKLWYQAGWRDGTMLALSRDGLLWMRPDLDVAAGTNRVLPARKSLVRHGTGISIDPYTADRQQRFKMLIFENDQRKTSAYTSPDGVHWNHRGYLPECGDNSTVFYNPFRKKWAFSIRLYRGGRARDYREHTDFVKGIQWGKDDVFPWANTDALDLPDPDVVAMMPPLDEIRKEAEKTGKKYDELLTKYRSDYGNPTQLYNLDAIAYESLVLGVFSILRGPHNHVCEQLKRPKLCDLELAYSRDGFHWHRPDRRPFLASTRKPESWERGYLHAGCGICTVVGDKLYFYYSGWSGKSPALGGHMYAGGSTGLAVLRRDGFASMNAGEKPGSLLTRPLRFSGRHLFVNADLGPGELRAEVVGDDGRAITPFTAEKCNPVRGDTTCERLTWKGADDLSALSGKTVRLRFLLDRGSLYAFWVTPDPGGESHGYVAAGGPGFPGPIDLPSDP